MSLLYDASAGFTGLVVTGCLAGLALMVLAAVAGALARRPRLRTVALGCLLVAAGGSLVAATGDPLSGLRLPDRVVGAAPRRAFPPAPATVTVRTGDSVWSITVDRLRRGAPEPAVATAWRRVLRLNATRLGGHPDLIHPGDRLRLPRHLTPTPASRGDHRP